MECAATTVYTNRNYWDWAKEAARKTQTTIKSKSKVKFLANGMDCMHLCI